MFAGIERQQKRRRRRRVLIKVSNKNLLSFRRWQKFTHTHARAHTNTQTKHTRQRTLLMVTSRLWLLLLLLLLLLPLLPRRCLCASCGKFSVAGIGQQTATVAPREHVHVFARVLRNFLVTHRNARACTPKQMLLLAHTNKAHSLRFHAQDACIKALCGAVWLCVCE